MIKLIVSDLDGTLMSGDHMTITPRTIEALRRSHDLGVKIAVATGRPMSIVGNVIEQIPFVDYIIYSNGACVFDRQLNKNIYEDLIDNTTARQIIAKLFDYPVFFEVYINASAHYQLDTQRYFISDDLPQDFLDEIKKELTAHENILDAVGEKAVEKVTLYCVKDSFAPQLEELFYGKGLSVASSFHENLEATSPTATKGEAVKNICKILGITAGEAMAFGDAGNDCDMLEFAGYSFAMGNATPQCKRSAKYVTLSNLDDGLAVAVEKYLLGGK